MASIELVETLMSDRLRADSPNEFQQAGTEWAEKIMSFYYDTEPQVNDCVETVMKEAIKFPKKDLSKDDWKTVKGKVNLATVVAEAIKTIAEISVRAE
jgi:hypothetical protein